MTQSVIYPPPLRPGDVVAVTAPSAPVVPGRHDARLDFVVHWLRNRGYVVRLGDCLLGDGITSAPVEQRAAEFNAFLADPDVRAIVPPWGGELAIDLVDRLEHDALRADPTWVVGWSDISTLLLPLTLRSGVATVHGQNLMDTPYDLPDGTAHWLDVVARAAGESVVQDDPGVRRRGGWDDWSQNPSVTTADLTETASWRRFEAPGDLDVTGRLIGGCLDVVCHLAGTPYGDVANWAPGRADGTIVYLENCETAALDAARMLHGLRLAGWFDHATAVLIGRSAAPDSPGFTQQDAIHDALAGVGVPIVADVDFGHVPPGNVLVNGALARVEMREGRHRITQSFV